jgi:MarR family 2-MHQ and catechol resistance regulon transcriptional repressor
VGTHYKGTARERRALDTFIRLSRAANSVSHRLNAGLARSGLTVGQFGVLEAIYHLGPLCLSDLSRKILTSEGNMTLIVDNLERDGLAERRRSRDDRRFVLVHLTERGRETIAEVFAAHVRQVVEVFGVLSEEEQERLGALCRKLGLSAAGPVTIPGPGTATD